MDLGDGRATQLLDDLADAGRAESRAAAHTLQVMLGFADFQQDQAQREDDPARRPWLISSIADEIALALGVSVNSVQTMLHRGRLVRSRLPQTWLAFGRGQIDAYVIQRVGELAGRLELDESFERFDAACARYAPEHTVAQTLTWAKRRVDTLEPWTKAERERSAHERRAVGVTYLDEGGAELWASLPTQLALEIEASLNATLETKAADDTRTRDQFLADELHHRLTHDGDRKLVSTEIVLTIPVASLAGITDAPAASLDEHTTLPAEVVRELLTHTETVFHRAITDPVGNVLDVTRVGRFFTGDLRTAITVRDGRCQGPGCCAPVREIDHVKPWPEGLTSASNGQGLCKRTHQLKTFGIFEVDLVEGVPVWTTPLGRNYPATRVQHPPDSGLPPASHLEYELAQFIARGP
ncbi:MAG TPA: DUF222 domain-containing protein [Aeromicrobium sp.]|nr:DUF222 domain-containing protein [Aeromicrobium sp.]